MGKRRRHPCKLLLLLFLLGWGWGSNSGLGVDDLDLDEASIQQLQVALDSGRLTSVALVQHYLRTISQLNPLLRSVIELNPDAVRLAANTDRLRNKNKKKNNNNKKKLGLLGIPILLKDNIATCDHLNTTAGSYALLGSRVARDAGVVAKLRRAGAIILGKANLSEWASFRLSKSSNGWSARGGQTKNPYNVTNGDPSGSSSGSAVAVAANMVAISLGTETAGSILSPASHNAVVGIKPTVGLTSRAGVVPISHHQDTIGPLCRCVSDAVEVLDVIVGFDEFDKEYTESAVGYIPKGGYKKFLQKDGLRGKRLGVFHTPFYNKIHTKQAAIINSHLLTMGNLGAEIIGNVTIDGIEDIRSGDSENIILDFDFKADLNQYLEQLLVSPVRSLAEIIQFNIQHAKEEKMDVYDQAVFLEAQKTSGPGSAEYREALKKVGLLTKHGIDKVLSSLNLDAIVAPTDTSLITVAAIAGYPGISVPAGYYDDNGVPFGILFVGKKGSEPTLIQISYSFEQATHIRKPPRVQAYNP